MAKLISYDLSKPGRDYASLFEAIKALGNWWHCLESVWIVDTSLSCADIVNRLKGHVDSNDKVAALSLGGMWATWGLGQECNDWLQNHV